MQQDLLLQSRAIHELKASFNKKAPENSEAFKRSGRDSNPRPPA